MSDDKNSWCIKAHGDTCEYRTMSKAKDTINYGFISIRSLVWKGFCLMYHNKQWTSMYVGNGFKCTDSWYYPQEPETLLNECNDCDEVPEPNYPPE